VAVPTQDVTNAVSLPLFSYRSLQTLRQSYVQLTEDNITFPKIVGSFSVVTLKVEEHLFSCVNYKMLMSPDQVQIF
jgi:hypothetical protein